MRRLWSFSFCEWDFLVVLFTVCFLLGELEQKKKKRFVCVYRQSVVFRPCHHCYYDAPPFRMCRLLNNSYITFTGCILRIGLTTVIFSYIVKRWQDRLEFPCKLNCMPNSSFRGTALSVTVL